MSTGGLPGFGAAAGHRVGPASTRLISEGEMSGPQPIDVQTDILIEDTARHGPPSEAENRSRAWRWLYAQSGGASAARLARAAGTEESRAAAAGRYRRLFCRRYESAFRRRARNSRRACRSARVLLGSDSRYEMAMLDCVNHARGLSIADNDKAAILSRTAATLLPLAARPFALPARTPVLNSPLAKLLRYRFLP